jgi:FkbM family methyltransferase
MLKKLIKNILSKKLIDWLIKLRNDHFDGYASKSYSQEGEDLILKRFFGGQVDGFYVDVGAHHPKRFSNTYLFYRKGWRGINIDAMPGSMVQFDRLRPRDINIEKPVSNKVETLKYYAFNEPALNGFSKEIALLRDDLKNYYIKFTKDIETTTLQQVLDGSMPKQKEIDFLTIDVEGLDMEVLRSIDLQMYTPKMILVEILKSDYSSIINSEVNKYLTIYDYSIYAKSGNTLFFEKMNNHNNL